MSKLCQDSPDSLNDLVQCYNTTLAAAIDSHARVVTKAIKVRPFIPWYSNDIKETKRERLRAERKWRRFDDISDLIVFKVNKNFTTHLINKTRFDFSQNFIDENRFHHRIYSWQQRGYFNRLTLLYFHFKDKLVLANQMGSINNQYNPY